MECQVEKLEHFRHILLFEFKRGNKALEVARNICAVYGVNAIGESMARKWFSRFKDDSFDIGDTTHSGRPSGFHEDCLNTFIHNDSCQYTRELANVMNCDHSTIMQYLHSMDKVKKLGVWVPHALSQNHKNQRVVICASLLARHRLACEQHLPYPLLLLVTRNGVFLWLSPNKRRLCQKCSNLSTWHSIF